MAINFKLVHRTQMPVPEVGNALGRTWAGWDDNASLDEIWSVNRGEWVVSGDRLRQERYATMSYDGYVRLVAQIDGFESVEGDYKVLNGRVLSADHPVSEALVGMPVVGHRNPVSYFDTTSLEETGGASGSPGRAFLLTYNPARFDLYGAEAAELQARIAAGQPAVGRWSVGRRTGVIGPGDVVYLLQQGDWGRGLVASGVVNSEVYQAEHFDPDIDELANYVDVAWNALLDEEGMLPVQELKERFPQQHWSPQGSGQSVKAEIVEDLATMWAAHVGLAVHTGQAPVPGGNAGQGRELDARVRKQIEDAAQDRLMRHFEAQGWHVEDRRFAGPYDALATKGSTCLFLEAKGTVTAGETVLVTRNEVLHARRNRGRCVLGVVSGLQLDANGNVDPESGELWVGPFDPDRGQLTPTTYNFAPDWEGFDTSGT